MTNGNKKARSVLIGVFVVLLIALAANALIDLGAVIHDATHPH